MYTQAPQYPFGLKYHTKSGVRHLLAVGIQMMQKNGYILSLEEMKVPTDFFPVVPCVNLLTAELLQLNQTNEATNQCSCRK